MACRQPKSLCLAASNTILRYIYPEDYEAAIMALNLPWSICNKLLELQDNLMFEAYYEEVMAFHVRDYEAFLLSEDELDENDDNYQETPCAKLKAAVIAIQAKKTHCPFSRRAQPGCGNNVQP